MILPTKKSASGFELPVLGFGTWGIGGYFEPDPANDDERDVAAIRYALSAGIHHIDTAELYAAGHAEEIVGRAVEGRDRASFTVATKAWRHLQSYPLLKETCRASLRRLKLDYVDLYYLHAANHDIPFAETARALKELRAEGLIRHYGVCNFAPDSMKRMQDLLDAPIAVNQSHYSLVYREVEIAGLLNHCREVGTLFAAWRPLMWHDTRRTTPASASAWQTGVYSILDETAAKLGKTNVQIALNWLISQPNVVALVKSSNPQHIDEALGAAGWEMPAETIEHLRANFPEQRRVSDVVPLG
jgi:diketogulonate reductase-like aldo/keto reductase